MRYRHPFTGLGASSFAPSGGFTAPQRVAPRPVAVAPRTVARNVPVKVPIPVRTSPIIFTQNTPPDQFRYSEDQIRDMLNRGQSETMERSGESDSGLPYADDLETKSREADATAAFIKDSNGVAPPELSEPPNPLAPLAILGALFYFL